MTYTLIKVSGDLYQNPSTIDFIRRISAKGDTVVCVGGGTQINQALLTAGYSLKKHGPLGRELYSQKERNIAAEVLMQNKSDLEGILLEKRIQAQVVVPIIQIGNTQCHVNGDEYVRVAYHGFQHLFVLTLADRVLGKKKEFQSEVFPKIEIIGI